MDDSKKDLSRLSVFFFQVGLGGAIKCFFTALKVRAQRTSRLGDGQAVVVFKEHVKRRRHSFLACNKRLSEKGTGLLGALFRTVSKPGRLAQPANSSWTGSASTRGSD